MISYNVHASDKTVGKALRNTQKKGKAFRIKANVIIKKSEESKEMLRRWYKHADEECHNLKAESHLLIVDLTETEDELLKLKKEKVKSKKRIMNLKKENMMVMMQVNKYKSESSFRPVLLTKPRKR